MTVGLLLLLTMLDLLGVLLMLFALDLLGFELPFGQDTVLVGAESTDTLLHVCYVLVDLGQAFLNPVLDVGVQAVEGNLVGIDVLIL